MQSLQQRASYVAIEAHSNQLYGDSNVPYYEHLYDVVGNVLEMYENDSEFQNDSVLQASAWLHDIMEDCEFTPVMLYGKGMPREVVDIVSALTKREGESKADYLNRIVASGESAIKIKIADSRANLAATLRSDVSEDQQRRLEKYTSNLVFLNRALLNLKGA